VPRGNLKIQLFTPQGCLILGLLVFVNILNFLDRLLPSILVEAIRRDLRLSDTQIGLMGGVAFAVVYSFGSIWLARVADRHSPRTVSRTRRWVVTSRPVVGSSSTISRGRQAKAMARATRCCCPPDSWCG